MFGGSHKCQRSEERGQRRTDHRWSLPSGGILLFTQPESNLHTPSSLGPSLASDLLQPICQFMGLPVYYLSTKPTPSKPMGRARILPAYLTL